MRGAEGVAVSPDGKSVYVSAAFGSVAIFDRNPATSALRQKPGVAGCIASTPRYRQRNRCRRGGPLGGSYQVAVSADGRNVYVTSAGSDGLAVFRRNPATGVLSQARGIGHCISEEGRRIGCRGARALEDAIDVALSPDGRNVYVTGFGSDAVAVLDRTR